ncbi:MAG: PTS lactose/cellobiose transporter subunit IIA [Clostridiales bacterium]|nr:PTS lactose/cellobiose transporter subunit IIA [Clostridiales bacterium]
MDEMIIFGLITASGSAKSHSMEAIQFAKTGDMVNAREAIKEAEDNLKEAHRSQTSLIQSEAKGEKIEISILLVHAQDHLMNAIMMKDLAKEFIDLYERVGQS